MKNFIKPDFTRSNLNISSTLAEFLGVPNKNATLSILKNELAKNYKNIVFICFDGMGIYPIEQNLDEEDFLRSNIKDVLVSTFPSTTTNATNSLMMNKLPLEHGWFGWSLYFEEENRNIDIFMNTDSSTGEKINIKESPLAPIDYYFDNAKSEYEVNSVFPSYVRVNNELANRSYVSEYEFFDILKELCDKDGKQFIYAYYPDPDHTMHDYGVKSFQAKCVMEELSQNMENLYNKTKDTLFIITADHGQIDVEGYVDFYRDEKLMDMLKIYPFLDARTPAFIVKEGRETEFEEYFRKTYSEDFELYKTKELIEKGYFGDFGDKAKLLGDYIAIGTYTHKQGVFYEGANRFKGHHTSLTEEMQVPLILINNKK